MKHGIWAELCVAKSSEMNLKGFSPRMILSFLDHRSRIQNETGSFGRIMCGKIMGNEFQMILPPMILPFLIHCLKIRAEHYGFC